MKASADRQAKRREVLELAHAHAVEVLAARPDITGIDIGPKYVGGKRKRQQVIRVHVAEKRKGRQLTKSERIPESFLGVPTDVIAARYQQHGGAFTFPSGRFDPIRPGVSVGSPTAKAGTLGLIVFDRETGEPCILSAGHVLAGPNAAEGDPVTQPSRFDHGSLAKDVVAKLFRFYQPGLWGDAALAKITKARTFVADTFDTGVVLTNAGIPQVNMRVAKTGRTTVTTRGRIEGIGTYYYPEQPCGVNGFRVVPHQDDPGKFDLCAPGDSGSIYYTEGTTTGIGLHCAGGVDPVLGEIGIACMLSTVLATLQATLVPPG